MTDILYSGEFYTRERVYVRETANDPRYRRASRALVRALPGVTTEHHRLTVRETYIVVRGRALMHLDGTPDRAIGPGDVVVIDAGQGQSVTVLGDAEFWIECICRPRFEASTYQQVRSD